MQQARGNQPRSGPNAARTCVCALSIAVTSGLSSRVANHSRRRSLQTSRSRRRMRSTVRRTCGTAAHVAMGSMPSAGGERRHESLQPAQTSRGATMPRIYIIHASRKRSPNHRHHPPLQFLPPSKAAARLAQRSWKSLLSSLQCRTACTAACRSRGCPVRRSQRWALRHRFRRNPDTAALPARSLPTGCACRGAIPRTCAGSHGIEYLKGMK